MSDDEDGLAMFQEPDGYFEPEKPFTFQEYTLKSGQKLNLRFVGHNPLWITIGLARLILERGEKGHMLWNGGRIVADHLEANVSSLVKDKTVLELGAGGGLPSLVCALHGARRVVVTDFPDQDLVDNLQHNISQLPSAANITAQGYKWGDDAAPLVEATTKTASSAGSNVFDTVILADLLFNHHCHISLLQSVQKCLSKTSSARALVFFTPYRPWLLQADLGFFDLVRDEASGLEVNELGTWQMDKVMFTEDPGDETLRRTVFGCELKWKSSHVES